MAKFDDYMSRVDDRHDDFIKSIIPNMEAHINHAGRNKHGETLLSKNVLDVVPLRTILNNIDKVSQSNVDVYGYSIPDWTPLVLDKIKVSGSRLIVERHSFVHRGKIYPILATQIDIPSGSLHHVYLFFDIQKGFGEIKLGPWMVETNFRSLIGYYRQPASLELMRYVKIEDFRLIS